MDSATPTPVHDSAAWNGHVQPECEFILPWFKIQTLKIENDRYLTCAVGLQEEEDEKIGPNNVFTGWNLNKTKKSEASSDGKS